MAVTGLATGLALVLTAFQGAGLAPVAEAVNLRDGAVILGQVEGINRRGELAILVRRVWAEENFPVRVVGWERIETDVVRLARLARRDRLVPWRRSREGTGPPGDPVLPWIDQELGRMSDPRPPRTVLMRVALPRGEVVSVVRRDLESSRLLRLGWLAGVPGVEGMAPEPLRKILAKRLMARADDPAAVDALLPLASETDAVWERRRGATEAVFESDLRFVRFREFILPEAGPVADVAAPATTTQLLDSPAAQEAFVSMLQVLPADPVRLRLEQAARRDRVGAIVSRVEFLADLAGAEAETALWVRQEAGGWTSVMSRRATARTDEPADRLGLESGPSALFFPIPTTVNVLELLAATPATLVASQERQVVAKAAQRALGRARVALDRDLGAVPK